MSTSCRVFRRSIFPSPLIVTCVNTSIVFKTCGWQPRAGVPACNVAVLCVYGLKQEVMFNCLLMTVSLFVCTCRCPPGRYAFRFGASDSTSRERNTTVFLRVEQASRHALNVTVAVNCSGGVEVAAQEVCKCKLKGLQGGDTAISQGWAACTYRLCAFHCER